MKKIIALMGAVCLILNLAACGGGKAQPEDISETTSTPTVSTENTDTSRTTPRYPNAPELTIDMLQENLFSYNYEGKNGAIMPNVTYTAVLQNTSDVPIQIHASLDVFGDGIEPLFTKNTTVPPMYLNPGEIAYVHERFNYDWGKELEEGMVEQIKSVTLNYKPEEHTYTYKDMPINVTNVTFELEEKKYEDLLPRYWITAEIEETEPEKVGFLSSISYVLTLWDKEGRLLYATFKGGETLYDDERLIREDVIGFRLGFTFDLIDPNIGIENIDVEILAKPQLFPEVSRELFVED